MTDVTDRSVTATGTLYALADPRDGTVRYIGQTTKPIEVRLAGHLAAPAPRVRAWIEALAVEGRSPEIIPIREHVPVVDLDAAEKEEIKAHAQRGDLLNVVANESGNAKRRKVSREEAKRRAAQEEAMRRAWQQATWRQVADQVRAATGGPVSPADIPIRDIPAAVWDAYQAYHEADRLLKANSITRLLLRPGLGVVVEGDAPHDQEKRAALLRRSNAEALLEHYLRAYCGAFSSVDDGERWGSKEGVHGRGAEAYRNEFRDPTHMARYLSLTPWAARALDPWVELARAAGIDKKGPEFSQWVSDDQATREAVDLYRLAAPGWLGVFRQRWDTDVATHALTLGAAHIPGFVVPHLLESALQDWLTKLARDRQATREMCLLLQRINPKALDAVYGRDRLAESDEALGLPPGTSAKVIRQLYGGDSHDPAPQAAKLIQRHTGEFDTAAIPDYSGWTGPDIPAMRAAAASFYSAGLLLDAEQSAGDELLDGVKSSWKPTRWGIENVEKMEKAIVGAAMHATDSAT
ncbi:MAG: hypothetical protein JWO67_3847 [Streptosporangiaceae bacterium]|nr:hypothetical protein [Streptosporangiaceae bacterium]